MGAGRISLVEFLKRFSESLPVRIHYLELDGLTPCELAGTELDTYLLRGGFPGGVLPETNSVSSE